MKPFAVLLGLVMTLSVLADRAAPKAPPPLIPRDVLFGNPERAAAQLSPDGKYLAYLAPDAKNVLQVWVRPLDQKEARQLTNDPKRGIRQYYWTHDGVHLLYLQDTDGDENFHLYAVDVAKGQTRELTPFKGVRVQGVDLSRDHPDEVLFSMNQRSRMAFDMHRLNLKTGAIKLDTQNPGMVMAWAADANFQVRAGTQARPDGGYDLLVRDAVDQPWRTLRTWPAEEQGAVIGFAKDPNQVWLIANHDANASRLLKVDIKTGKEEVVAADPEFDLSGALVDDARRVPLAVSFTRARSEWQVLDPSVADDLAVLAKVRHGDFNITSQTRDNQKWLVAYNADNGPAATYLYDRATKKAELLFTNQPKLENLPLAKMEPIEYTATDGLKIRGYLTRPVGVEEKNLPLVLLVHGGPWARDFWGFNPLVQFLANRGYAVLQVNFRGSTGYGKKFLNAGNREWAGKMHQDLIDGVNWAVKQGVADPKRVAIMGGSYGGYATLVGLTFTPDVFRCGVDIVGPSSIMTLLRSIPPYWAPMQAMFAKRVGDIKTDEEFLNSRSPLYRVDQIRAPLLIGQGANDPRVKQAESDQIVAALRKANKTVQYVVYPDEGHGFVRPENRLHFFAITEAFLAEHLGGRYEPLGEIKGHSGELR